jgi:hypothetical protein
VEDDAMFWDILQKIFGTGREKRLVSVYTEVLQGAGYSRDEAERRVKDAIQRFSRETGDEGPDDLPDKKGDHIIEGAKEGRDDCRRIVRAAKDEGATEEDIRRWWNRSSVERRLICWAEKIAVRDPMYETAKEYGLSDEEARRKVRQFFPVYGDPDEAEDMADEDRPLPHELRDRIEKYRRTQDRSDMREKLKDFSSYNAFVRHEIREGKL